MPVLRLIPQTCSDALISRTENDDCFNFWQLSNLVPSPDSPAQLVPRPAASKFANSDKGVLITCQLIVGNYIYGMMNDPLGSGKDVPFVFDIINSAYIAVSGVNTATNCPASSNTGFPAHAEPVGGYIIVTHPGFSGTGSMFFGAIALPGSQAWGQIWHASIPTVTAINWTTHSGFQQWIEYTLDFTRNYATGGTFQLTVNGTSTSNIPYNASAAAVQNALIAAGLNAVVSGGPCASASLDIVTYGANSYPWPYPPRIDAGTSNLTGGGSYTQGFGNVGTYTWNVQNTSTNALPSAPVWCTEFNSRAYYYCNPSGIVPALYWSDNLSAGGPLSRSSAVAGQILTFGDNTPLIGGEKLTITVLTGNVMAALYVFKTALAGSPNIYQVTGDTGTNNLDVQPLNASVGTIAPNALVRTNQGLFFLSPDGPRFINLNGQVDPPFAISGAGIAAPFIYSLNPGAMVAACNGALLAVATANQKTGNNELWIYDLPRRMWHGPHTFPVGHINGWGASFIASPAAGSGQTGLFKLGFIPALANTYIELGQLLNCSYRSALVPDRREIMELTSHKAIAQLGCPAGTVFSVTAYDQGGNTLGSATIGPMPSLLKIGPAEVPWPNPMTFDKVSVSITVAAADGIRIAPFHLDVRETGMTARPA